MKGLMLAAVLVSAAMAPAADAAAPEGATLVEALRQGGYVLLVRHASSPRTPPAAGAADPGNVKGERQLDGAGKRTATAMGAAIRTLRLPIGEVWSSPTYRALETVRLAGLPRPRTVVELGDGGQSMQASSGDQSAWLKAKVAEPPRSGTDTVIVTHYPNISAAFGDTAKNLGDGETLVFRPNGKGAASLAGRIKIEDWPRLAAR